MKNKKNCIALIFLTLFLAQTGISQRNTIWANGALFHTSKPWSDFRQEMTWRGYDFKDLMDDNTEAADNGILTYAAYLDQRVGDKENVLGIAHGYGGVALRYVQHLNPNIQAMVLCGVPNQGSIAIEAATITNSESKTEFQILVEAIESMKEGDDCQNCNVTGIFKNWIDGLQAAGSYLGNLRPNNDIIIDINEPDMLPTVPYVVLYGTVEEFSLTRMLDSRAFASDSDYLTRCHNERILEEQKRLEAMHALAVMNLVSGLLSSTVDLVGSVVSASTPELNPGAIISAAGTHIQESSEAIIQKIEDDLENELELARMLRCQLADQVLEAHWMLALLDGQFEEQEVYVSNPLTQEHINWCEADCEEQFPEEIDPNAHHHCLVDCFSNTGGYYQTITVFVPELNDGLLTAKEQQLNGSMMADEIHLPNTNHFQETFRGNVVLTDAFESIFEGNLGAAFIVPKD